MRRSVCRSKKKLLNQIILPSVEDSKRVISQKSLPIQSCPLPHLLVWVCELINTEGGLSKSYIKNINSVMNDFYLHAVNQGEIEFHIIHLKIWKDWTELQFSNGEIAASRKCARNYLIGFISRFIHTGQYTTGKYDPYDVSESFKSTETYQSVISVLNIIRPKYQPSTYEQLVSLAKKLLRFAEKFNYKILNHYFLQQYLNLEVKADTKDSYKLLAIISVLDRLKKLHLTNPINGFLLTGNEFKHSYCVHNDAISTEQTFEFLIYKSKRILINLGLSSSTVKQYIHAWRLLIAFTIPKYGEIYSRVGVEEFVKDVNEKYSSGKLQKWKCKCYRRAAFVLIEVAQNGTFSWKEFQILKPKLPPEIEELKNSFLQYKKNKQLSEARLSFYSYIVRAFFFTTGIKTIAQLRLLDDKSVIAVSKHFRDVCCNNSLSNVIPSLRAFYEWLFISGYTSKNYTGILISSSFIDNHVVSYFSEQDELILRKYILKLKPRSRAIILLALDLGMRNGDILNLRLSNINWDTEQITIIQHKTGVKAIFPLLENVGNALFQYLTQDRPKDAESDYVFVRELAPHKHLNSTYDIIHKITDRLGISPENGHGKGAHILRRTYTRRLLSSGKMKHQEITDALGHISNDSDNHYRSMEDDKLGLCCLDLSEIGTFRWED